LTEEVIKTMFFTRLTLISAVLFTAGALVTAAAGVLAQQGPGPRPAPVVDQPKEPVTAGTRRASEVEPASVPSHIQRSRKMMITRLEEEREAAKQRLDRTIRKAAAPDDSAVVQASKTLQDLDDLLIRIDRALVEAVRSHPTIFDFSGAAEFTDLIVQAKDEWAKAAAAWADQPNARAMDMRSEEVAKGKADWTEHMYKNVYVSKTTADLERSRYESSKQIRLGNRKLAASILLEATLTRAKERAEWRDGMSKKGYATKQQVESDRKEYEDLKRDIAHALDRIDWAENSFKKGFISKENLDSAYKDCESLVARQSSDRPVNQKP
jgi:hypothetical protein